MSHRLDRINGSTTIENVIDPVSVDAVLTTVATSNSALDPLPKSSSDTAAAADPGLRVLAVRQDNAAVVGTDGNYTSLYTDERGALRATLPAETTDLFGRFKVTQPQTIWDSSFQGGSARPDRWSTTVTGSGGAALNTATMEITSGAAGTASFESRRKMTYQPGKTMTVIISGCLAAATSADSVHRLGLYNDTNGVYFEYNSAATPPLRLVILTEDSGGTGSIVVPSSSFDAAVSSFDPTARAIFFFNFKWLGSGNIQAGVFMPAKPNAPSIAYDYIFVQQAGEQEPYWADASLPVRAYCGSAAAGGAQTNLICAACYSDGGYNPRGTLAASARSALCTNIDIANETVIMAVRCNNLSTTLIVLSLFVYSQQVTDALQYRVYVAYGVSGGTLLSSGTWNATADRVGEWNEYDPALGLPSPTVTAAAGPYLIDTFFELDNTTRSMDYSDQVLLNLDTAGNFDILYITAQSTNNNNRDATCSVRWQEL